MHGVIRLDSSPLKVGTIQQCGKGVLGSPLSSTTIPVTEAVTVSTAVSEKTFGEAVSTNHLIS